MKAIVMSFFLLILASQSFANNFTSAQIITACDMSTASCTSSVVDTNQLPVIGLQAVYAGSPNGTIVVQVSGDNVPLASSVTNWTTYPSSSQSIAAAGSFVWNIAPFGFRWVRLLYTKVSGTGTLNATFNGKQ